MIKNNLKRSKIFQKNKKSKIFDSNEKNVSSKYWNIIEKTRNNGEH